MHLCNGSKVSDDTEHLVDLKGNDTNGSARGAVVLAADSLKDKCYD